MLLLSHTQNYKYWPCSLSACFLFITISTAEDSFENIELCNFQDNKYKQWNSVLTFCCSIVISLQYHIAILDYPCVCVCVVKLPQMFCLSQLLATSECVSSTHYNDSINSYYTVYTRLVIIDDLGFYFSWKIVTLRTTVDHPVKDECRFLFLECFDFMWYTCTCRLLTHCLKKICTLI